MEEKSQLDEMRRSIGAARARVSASRSGLQSVAGDAPPLREAAREPEPAFARRPAVEEAESPAPGPPGPIAVTEPDTEPEPQRADDESSSPAPEPAPATAASLLARIRASLRAARQL